MFSPDELERLAPRLRGKARIESQSLKELDPISATEAIAYDFLAKGGKYARPFITLAVHDALTGGRGTQADGAKFLSDESYDSVKRAAMSIEAFHKASLVHDDIQDDDAYRYGEDTVHRRFGLATAINIGDYLIGLGYRLVSRETGKLGSDTTADVMDNLAEAHLKLSEGQGAELAWRDSGNRQLSPLDALRIYALKTAPAFEAALLTGVRLAGPADEFKQPLKVFARNLGVAFQILNDLKDWREDPTNKVLAGGDISGGRPTLLWALALEGLPEEQRQALISLADQTADRPEQLSYRLTQVRRAYHQANVFEKAQRLVEKHRERAEAAADEIQVEELRRLPYYLIDTVLEPEAAPAPPQIIVASDDLAASLPLTANTKLA